MNRKALLLATVGAALVAAAALANEPAPVVRTGSAAPNWTLVDANGKTHNLRDFRGKFVVMEWTNHQCPFVVRQYRNGAMQATQKWATDNGAIWLAVVSSAPGKQGYVDAAGAREVKGQTKFAGTAKLLDPDGKVGKAFGARTTPHMFVIDPKGVLIYQGAIDDQPNPEPTGRATNFVRQALEEAKAGKPVSKPETKPYGCSVKYP